MDRRSLWLILSKATLPCYIKCLSQKKPSYLWNTWPFLLWNWIWCQIFWARSWVRSWVQKIQKEILKKNFIHPPLRGFSSILYHHTSILSCLTWVKALVFETMWIYKESLSSSWWLLVFSIVFHVHHLHLDLLWWLKVDWPTNCHMNSNERDKGCRKMNGSNIDKKMWFFLSKRL